MKPFQILFNPERESKCDCCGLSAINVRIFSASVYKTKFCKTCWESFLDECNVPVNEPWVGEVASLWENDVIVMIKFTGNIYGDSQRYKICS